MKIERAEIKFEDTVNLFGTAMLGQYSNMITLVQNGLKMESTINILKGIELINASFWGLIVATSQNKPNEVKELKNQIENQVKIFFEISNFMQEKPKND